MANLIIIILNLLPMVIALMVGEYEVAKFRAPDASWIQTPTLIDLTLAGFILGLTVINLSVIFFVLSRKLHNHRRWLWWTTGCAILLAMTLGIVLGNRFWPIVWP